jgi:prepilin-type N-terminal cleavage/methylation domain-containing protein
MSRRFRASGFTAAEMLVASAIAGIVAGTAALTIYTVTLAQRQYTQIATFTLPNGALANFYPGQSGNSVNCAVAPNFSAVSQAESMREKFILDVSQAVGVYCLARNSGNYNTIRPTGITAPPAGTNIDTPEAFRVYLGTLYASASTTFVSYRNFPTTAPCLSIFVLGYSNNSAIIPVTAVYDLDIVSAKNPLSGTVVGNYAAVRRFVNGALSAYYDCCFQLSGEGTDSWYPSVISFERQVRKAVAEGSSSIDRFKIAEEKPFSLVFWPDPSRSSLKLPNGNTTSSYNASFSSTDPRKAYNHMGGRTAFMFVVPLFPSSS